MTKPTVAIHVFSRESWLLLKKSLYSSVRDAIYSLLWSFVYQLLQNKLCVDVVLCDQVHFAEIDCSFTI